MFEARLKLVGLVGRSTVNAVTFHREFNANIITSIGLISSTIFYDIIEA